MTKTAREYVEALQFIEEEWTDLGPSKPNRRDKLPVPRKQLRLLVDMGLILVRTATYSYWGWHRDLDPAQNGQRVQACLTAQGIDVKGSFG